MLAPVHFEVHAARQDRQVRDVHHETVHAGNHARRGRFRRGTRNYGRAVVWRAGAVQVRAGNFTHQCRGYARRALPAAQADPPASLPCGNAKWHVKAAPGPT
ncbi:hypothetical protein GCM10008959_18790 [Deinococcus seoulensis]|uniref:Uncharacterized protein n=1 Tax=Deinococcus seoulensis TaxID=1837379 RepID=A0ABQ2RQE9_9DEIO|nr:hypothetical protein GCM10008959_18790 [Deinococcus seoulensis]